MWRLQCTARFQHYFLSSQKEVMFVDVNIGIRSIQNRDSKNYNQGQKYN